MPTAKVQATANAVLKAHRFTNKVASSFINGTYCMTPALASKNLALMNPASKDSLVANLAMAGQAEVDHALEFSAKAFKNWARNVDVLDKFRIMTRIAEKLREELDDMAYLESLQTGRPIKEMKTQLARIPEWIDYFASLQRTWEGNVTPMKGQMLNYIERKPLGVVLQITPWNHPLLIAVKKIAPAIAAGNCVIVKPSELAPLNVLRFAELCVECGLPPGVLNVLIGSGPEIGPLLTSSPVIAKVDITGGTETGRKVASQAGNNLVECVAELGGKAPVIIMPDSLDEGVVGATFAAFIATGQTCVMGSRILVHESIHAEFLEKFSKKVQGLIIGDPLDPKTQIGPVINSDSLRRIHSHVTKAQNQGAKLVCGGKIAADLDGHFYEPTVLSDVTPLMDVFNEELFGPVVVVTPFKDMNEAIQLANHSEFGLAASVWTKDISQAHKIANELDVGIVWINGHHHNDPSSPWGGVKLSGMGRENGMEAFRAYTSPKSVVVNYGGVGDWFSRNEQGPVRYG